jgi:hypothetical protein
MALRIWVTSVILVSLPRQARLVCPGLPIEVILAGHSVGKALDQQLQVVLSLKCPIATLREMRRDYRTDKVPSKTRRTSMCPASSGLTRRCILRALAVVTTFGLVILVVVNSTQTGSAYNAGAFDKAESLGGGDEKSSPIFGVKIPDGYRQWELVSVSQGPEELKSIVGNAGALKAYRDEKVPFPEGSILVKLSWKRTPLAGFKGDFVPGPATMVQIMVKDAKKYAATGGWGFGRFYDGKPANEAEHKTCFACHSKNEKVRGQDFVFTRLAP